MEASHTITQCIDISIQKTVSICVFLSSLREKTERYKIGAANLFAVVFTKQTLTLGSRRKLWIIEKYLTLWTRLNSVDSFQS